MKKVLVSISLLFMIFFLVNCSGKSINVVEKRFLKEGYSVEEQTLITNQEHSTSENYDIELFKEYGGQKLFLIKDANDNEVGIMVEFKTEAEVDAFLNSVFGDAEKLEEFFMVDLKFENVFMLPFKNWSVMIDIFQGR